MTETIEQLRQDRDAYKQAYENMCVFYKQLVLANQRLAASHEAVEHRVQSDECLCSSDRKHDFRFYTMGHVQLCEWCGTRR